MSTSVATATSASASAANTCGASTYNIPIKDAACALPASPPRPLHSFSPHSVLSQCCNNADVHSFSGGCGLYCLALGQSVGDLQKCLMNQTKDPGQVFCNTEKKNATATASSDTASKTASATSSSSTSTGSADSSHKKSDASRVTISGLGLLLLVGSLAWL